MDNDIKIPGLPLEETTHNLFKLKYNVRQDYRLSLSIIFKFSVTIEAIYLDEYHPLKSMNLNVLYEASINGINPYLMSDPIMFQLQHYILSIRNNIFNIIDLPLEDIPLHINDPEPYKDLVHWRLYLPRPNLTPHYAFAYRDVALLPD